MMNESDYEWLKLYHYIITTTEFVRCKGYPVTDVLAMLTLGIEETVEGDIRNKLKKPGKPDRPIHHLENLGWTNGTNCEDK